MDHDESDDGPRDVETYGADGDAIPLPSELLDYLRETLGADLRRVVHYDAHTIAVAADEDVGTSYTEAELHDLVEDLRLRDLGRPIQERFHEFGSLYCSLHAFDDALLVHFVQDRRRGTLVELDPSRAPVITDFVHDVLEILDEFSEQEIARAPQWARE
ncbi:hypothetical protein J2752_000912 [Halarchaeum rubridurum]|uniref:Uncharacterized protein n=1 Tax=Halarchaeum rubridurum TaxID=489911 RepID=A0A830FXY1_9EURY|nr:hypothetical protein [Halarchaeum rubridurum]MBP1954031.1 hypothetical protein [Halarchaeum rubridurum]GGM56801.1 hypothetical protein GCM10009017_03700 [Halarchaeum rubridurum]